MPQRAAQHEPDEGLQDRMTEQQARLMFGRYLRNWASDALELRRRGLDRPGPRTNPASDHAPGVPGRRAA